MTLPSGWGVGIPSQTIPDPRPAYAALQPTATHWLNWGAYYSGRPGGDDYLPMMYKNATHRVPGYFERAIAGTNNPWLLGNEYDLKGQANSTPSFAIAAINEIRAMGVDEWIGPNCCLNNRSFGWAWMDEYVRFGGPTPNAWGIHLYDCPTINVFKEKFEDFYNWMVRHHVQRPIIVTETSGERAAVRDQIALMQGIDTMLRTDNRLRAVAWFSADYGLPSDLLADGQLTELGRAFVEL